VIETAVLRADVWSAVHAMTEPSKRAIMLADGVTIYGVVPSLWDQGSDALAGGMESAVRVSNAAERSPVDLNLVELRSLIRHTVSRELHARRVKPRADVPAQLSQLAAHVVTYSADELWWWDYRFTSWASMLTLFLSVNDHVPTARRLRNSPCPACRVRQVTIESDDGPVVVPTLVVDFRDGYVQAARCSSCSATWWRGADLESLAALLGCVSV
jgi:hypothetical protein